jgi:cell wall-associated NlpC family hydrolase
VKKILRLVAIFVVLAITLSFYTQGSPKDSLHEDEVLVEDETSLILEPMSSMDSPTLRDSIVDLGRQLLGTPYVEAGCSANGFDCSGFVFYVFKHFSIEVPRSSSLYENFGTEVPIGDVQIGDVLVFKSPTRNTIGHVGIVTKSEGMESEFIHATSGKAKQVVVSSLKLDGYKNRFIKAVDVLD